jgi:hypothetical protein
MKPAIRLYQEGDLFRFESCLSLGVDRKELEDSILPAESFTFYETETKRVLGCFGGIIVPGGESLVVWLDISERMRERYPLFLVRTIKRHRDHAGRRYGVARFITNVRNADDVSLDWIEMLGFERITDMDDFMPGSHLYGMEA